MAKGDIELPGNRNSYNNSVMERDWPRKMVLCIINYCMPCGLQHIYVIRGLNLVYEVETEAAKLKSSGTGLSPGLNGGLARLRQVSQVRGGSVGGKRTAYHQVSECEGYQ